MLARILRSNKSYYLAVCLLLSLETSLAQTFETTAEYYEDAVNHMADKSFPIAETQLKNALQLDPAHLPSHILLGIVYLEMAKYQQAEQALVKARQLGADKNLIAVPMAQAMLNLDKYSKLERYAALKNRSKKVESRLQILLSSSYQAQSRDKEAEEALLDAEMLAPDKPEPLLAQLSYYMRKSEEEKTEALLERLKEMAPDMPEVWMRQAQYYEYSGELDAAYDAYSKVLALNPEFVNARVARAAVVQRRDENHDWVLEELQPLVEKYEELLNPEMIYTYVVSLLKKKRIDEAREMTEIAKKRLNFLGEDVMNQYPSLLLLDISLAIFENDLFKAQDSANRLLLISPSNSSARVLLGKIYLEMGDAKRALEAMEPVYTYKRNDPSFLSMYGRALLETGNARDAIYELILARDNGYQKRDLYHTLALTLLALNRPKEAISELEVATEMYPDDVGLGVMLTRLYLQNGDNRAAGKSLEKLSQLDKQDPRILNYQGLHQLANNQPEPAESFFKQALDIDPQYEEGLLNLARLYIIDKRFVEATELLNRVLEVNSVSMDAMVGLAQVSDLQGDVPGAIRWFERIWADNKTAVPQAIMLIRLYRRESMFPEAVRTADILFEKNPDDFQVLKTLVETLIDAQQPDMALQQLKSSLRYSSDFTVEQLYELAELQMRVDDIAGAANTLSRSLTVKKDFMPAKIQLVRLSTNMRRYEEALKQAEEISTVQPEYNLGEALKGDVYLAMGEVQKAYEAYQKALSISESTSLHQNIYNIEAEMYGPKKALIKFEQWAKTRPDDSDAQYGLAIAYIDTGRYEDSLNLHHKLLDKTPDNPVLMNNIAWLMQVRKDKGAYEYAKSAHQRFPENPAILDTYGWILTENNQAELGLRYLRQAMSRASADPSTRYHLALALSKLGRIDEAISTLEELMQEQPEFHEEEQALALLNELKKSAN